MPRTPHSPEFLTVRDALLDLDDADRRRLVGMYGSMTDPLPIPSLAFIAFFRTIAALSDDDHRRLAKWIGQFVSKFGGVPSAASQRIKPAPREKRPTV
jgi:hypothetical protein